MGVVRGRRPLPFSLLGKESLGYQKLAQSPLCNLSIVDPDGFCFDVMTLETATVAELKEAVEHSFVQTLEEQDRCLISWSHVWSHFCLCFEGHKLINDKDFILCFGIRDGCQLHFIQHRYINFGLTKEFHERRISTRKQPKITLAGSDLEDVELYEGVSTVNESEAHSEVTVAAVKSPHFLKDLLSRIGIGCFWRRRMQRKVRPFINN